MAPELPRPRLATLSLLVGRITTIKLVYWAAITAAEIAIALWDRPFEERFAASLGVFAAMTALAALWAVRSAGSIDPRAGRLERSIPTVVTAFIAASVVASPASLPLLVIERQRSVEGCFPAVCHWEAIWYWVAVLACGTLIVPLAFAIGMRREARR